MLTQQQRAFFDAFGFLALPGLLADRVGRITEEFDRLFASHGGGFNGQPHDGKQRSILFPFIDRSEELCTLLDDPRVEGVAAGLLGEDFNYLGSDGNYYAGDTAWHSDGLHSEYRFLKIALYLDPLTRDTGALRVIPGSHKVGDAFPTALLKGLSDPAIWNLPGRDIPSTALETRPGDVLVFNHNIMHASYGGSARRRMFTLNLCERASKERVGELRDYIHSHSRFLLDSLYGEAMVRTAGARRRVHLEQVLSNMDQLPELSRKERLVRTEPSRH